MLLNIISLFTGFVCFALGLFFLSSKGNNSRINFYFKLILTLFGFIRFEFALETLGIISTPFSPLRSRTSFALFLAPVFYLFFDKLYRQEAPAKKDLLYFIPTILTILLIDFSLSFDLNTYKYVTSINYLLYFLSILFLSHHYLMKRKFNSQKTKYLQSIKFWAIINIFLLTSIMFIGVYLLFIIEDRYQVMQQFYKYSSFTWLFIIYYLFKNPFIIFGERYLINNIQISKKEDFKIWELKALKGIEKKDLSIYRNCKENIAAIILEISKLEHNEAIISKETLKIDYLARTIKIPKSHMEFIFKYHCYYSVNDYINLVKIKYVLRLLDSRYLDHKTINSLTEKALFTSRTAFFINFKKFVGVPITTYLNKIEACPERYLPYVYK